MHIDSGMPRKALKSPVNRFSSGKRACVLHLVAFWSPEAGKKEFLHRQQQKIWGIWLSGLFERLKYQKPANRVNLAKKSCSWFSCSSEETPSGFGLLQKNRKTPVINTFDRSTTGLYTTGNKGLIQVVAGNKRLMRVWKGSSVPFMRKTGTVYAWIRFHLCAKPPEMPVPFMRG